MATKPNEYLRFANCGFSDQAIRALLIGGIDSPERLLSMTPNQIRLIRGIGPILVKEVERYLAQFDVRATLPKGNGRCERTDVTKGMAPIKVRRGNQKV